MKKDDRIDLLVISMSIFLAFAAFLEISHSGKDFVEGLVKHLEDSNFLE